MKVRFKFYKLSLFFHSVCYQTNEKKSFQFLNCRLSSCPMTQSLRVARWVWEKCSPTIFCRNYLKTFTVEKVEQKFRLLLYVQKMPKVKNHPKGENSPNLVTLLIILRESSRFRVCVETWLTWVRHFNLNVMSDNSTTITDLPRMYI
jgi:hypothetical protein